MQRKFPKKVKRVVVKIGSSLIANHAMKPRTSRLQSLVNQISVLRKKDVEVVLVSSGAIVLGMGALDMKMRPGDLSSLQACAAIGQTILMQTFSNLFKKDNQVCAQVLLTWDDFDNRSRFNNARKTLESIIDRRVIPIINENDTISTDEIKFGDNDKLSALTASLIHANALIILSDVEGLYEVKDGEKKVFSEIREITKEIEGIATGTTKKHFSKGGMKAKLEAVKIATQANVPCIITNGRIPDVLVRVVGGESIGTFFVEKEEKTLARKHWISFGAKPKGTIVVDEGAKKALLKGGRSLLLPGIVKWEGHFKSDDVVIVVDQKNHEIARGIINYSNTDLHKIEDKKKKQEVIHRNDLVLCER